MDTSEKKIGGYHGAGHRLGSPVPGEVLVNNEASSQPDIKTETEISKPKDEGEGDSTVQIRFANGKEHHINSILPILFSRFMNLLKIMNIILNLLDHSL